MWRCTVLMVLIFALINGINEKTVMASDEKMDWGLTNLSINDINTAEIRWSTHNRIMLKKEEIYILVSLLREVQKDDVTQYKGPGPKGGPARINILLKSNEKLTLVLNGDHFLFRGRQVYQIYLPELNAFTFSRIKKYSNSLN
ncbi:hypothetical protein [Paenibacillus sp. LHD-38]|uniref:hypothetical protein n=1 Tax=Paenibacillus sp. LHD-38 TaxID=3072143 RepID=UPI0028106F48|nr:hypothetical protein [Paenibacillus sp. LHD-38]MDQ8736359.1 hypothetical protein [Paenibacillus sp. LHD-38]